MITRNKVILAALLIPLAAAILFSGDAWAGRKAKAAAPPILAPAATAVNDIRFLGDGAVHNTTTGVWELPAQGTCPADLTRTTRPDCLALRLDVVQASCTGNYSWSTGVCNDTDPAVVDQGTCESKGDRLWNAATSVCAVVMKGHDRNNVQCAVEGGTWVTSGACIGNWIMPARTAYTPNLLTGTGPGDQCLRCHNSVTQYNGPRVRDVEKFLQTGHRNMVRNVTPGTPLVGPDGNPYPSDDGGNPINWANGTINVGGTDRTLRWIYGDWLSPLPRAIYEAPAKTDGTPSISYSCGRCHATGWTSDSAVRSEKEPESTFPGISWDGTTTPADNMVNLKGSVSGDSRKTSSWDVWGIQCSRCHASSVDRATGTGNPPQYSSPTGMSSHHNNLTTAEYPGVCTNSSKRDRASCEAAGAVWNFGFCSDPRFTTKTQCEDANLYWPNAGSPGFPVGTWMTPCSNYLYGNQVDCEANGGTWTEPATSSCSIAGVCNDPAYTNQADCEANGKQWAVTTDIVRCIDADGKWTGSFTNRGQIILSVCMNCHRQESSGLPYDGGADPAGALKVGLSHGALGFVSHPGGNEFLNSTHGRYTGDFAHIPLAVHSFAPNVANTYNSYFMMDGEAANTGNGCTGCHNIHESVVPETGHTGAFREECQECHAKDLSRMRHPMGAGTPIENPSEPFEACITCHMPEGIHLFRISDSSTYSTFPQGALTGTVNANTLPDDGYTKAVWVDLDLACGQCHGGGTSTFTTTGAMTAGSTSLTVPGNSANFFVMEKVKVVGAGANGSDLVATIAAKPDANTVTLTTGATASVAGATVVTNPTSDVAPYFTKAQCAAYADGIHNDAPVVSFTYALEPTNTLQANFNGGATVCSGACDAYSWDFGDGATGSGVTTSHVYAAAGTYTVTLTVTEYGVGSGSKSKTIKVVAPDPPPTANGNCTLDANSWVETCIDNSSADTVFVSFNWGDGTVVSNGTRGQTFVHTYKRAGTFTITETVRDAAGQTSTYRKTEQTQSFAASGTVFASNGTTPVRSAMVKYVSGSFSRIAYTAINGTYTITGLKPGTYSVYVTRYGYTFASPALSGLVFGPSSGGHNVNAVNP